jgi:3-hydroxyanthranilate 3,4-dioxygenase
MGSLTKKLNINKWLAEHAHELKPPVSNQVIFPESEDYTVMLVGGPNARNDFHINAGEELFYQLKGSILVRIREEGQTIEHRLDEGDMLLVPAFTPHNPCRPEGSIGLVIEHPREIEETDGFQWYCDNCGNLLHEHYEIITDIVIQLPPIMNAFQQSVDLRTCKNCGQLAEVPGPFVLKS